MNPACSVKEVIDEQQGSDKRLASWLTSLADEGLAKATLRAEKASDFLTSIRTRVGDRATGTVASVLSCLTEPTPQGSPVSTAGTGARVPARPDPVVSTAEGYAVGSLDLGATVGLGGTGFGGSASIGGRLEKAIKGLDNGILSIGGFVQRWTYDPCLGRFSNCGASLTFIGATVNYHFVLKSHRKWDPFVGAGLGYGRFSWSGTDFGDALAAGGVGFVANAGVRYFFSEKAAIYADLGAGATVANVGLMFKLN